MNSAAGRGNNDQWSYFAIRRHRLQDLVWSGRDRFLLEIERVELVVGAKWPQIGERDEHNGENDAGNARGDRPKRQARNCQGGKGEKNEDRGYDGESTVGSWLQENHDRENKLHDHGGPGEKSIPTRAGCSCWSFLFFHSACSKAEHVVQRGDGYNDDDQCLREVFHDGQPARRRNPHQANVENEIPEEEK